MKPGVVDASISTDGLLDILSKSEVARLLDTSQSGLYRLFRNCSLAVLNSGSYLDDGKELLERYRSFDIRIVQEERGIKLELVGVPAIAFVDDKMIRGIREHLVAVVRDVLYANEELNRFDLNTREGTTDAVFHFLRNAKVLIPQIPNLVVCWGGHSISRDEYDYTKQVGYQLGLRGMNICTGCGPGAMKGPMKGATIGHSKQRIKNGRYVGISEPGIVAAESPNPIVNELVIMPDIEKRLEAFARTGHGFVVFPGGAGTMEEILYLLGVLLHPDNQPIPFPLVLTAPAGAKDYLQRLDQFIGSTLGREAQNQYEIIVHDPEAVARYLASGMQQVKDFRQETDDAYYFNWLLKIERDFQVPFKPTHDNMRSIDLRSDQPKHMLAAGLRRAFSGIVSGNVKDEGIRAIEQHGHFEIVGDREIMEPVDSLLSSFVKQNRMKLSTEDYQPCYRIIR
ncbi:MAG: nucleotide 5'-monophosphate nucleosidase PpnN [Arenicellales bacterium]|nr:nucleotide 5'-monophosphate nucleosidase PpnN [Arenicellales bacterium]